MTDINNSWILGLIRDMIRDMICFYEFFFLSWFISSNNAILYHLKADEMSSDFGFATKLSLNFSWIIYFQQQANSFKCTITISKRLEIGD
jgi:hypothetical protein